MKRRHDEFSIVVCWRPKGSLAAGLDKRPPGFYVVAGWANEGVADFPINYERLTNDGLRGVMKAVDEATGCDGTFAENAGWMLTARDRQVEVRRQALEASIQQAQDELAAIDVAAQDPPEGWPR